MTFTSFFDTIWWGVVTLTTVGYGDIHPQTNIGKAVAMFLMVSGVGIFSIVVGEFGSKIMTSQSKAAKGLKKIKIDNHIIICCSDTSIIEEIIEEYKKDKSHKKQKFVIISEEKQNPLTGTKYEKIKWVNGESGDPEILNKANLEEANLVYVFNKEDAETILTTLQVKSMYKNIKVIARYYEESSLKYLKAAECDHTVNPNTLSIPLLVQVGQNPFVLEWIEKIVTRNPNSPSIYNSKIPSKYTNKSWLEFINDYKKTTENQVVTLIQNNEFITNPQSNKIILENDRCLVISNKKPKEN